MTLTEFLIIYLACGAPFGVYYFFQNFKKNSLRIAMLNSFLTTIVWIPYALRLFLKNVKPKLNSDIFSRTDGKIVETKPDFARFEEKFTDTIRKHNINISLFDFRDTFNRYVGLSESIKFSSSQPTNAEKEFFRITEKENSILSPICLHRRNLKRLNAHLKSAGDDLVKIFNQIEANLSEDERQKFREDVSSLFAVCSQPNQIPVSFDSPDNNRQISNEQKLVNRKVLWTP